MNDDECGLECPRHTGKTCIVTGIGDFGVIFGQRKGPAIRSAKTTRHRHSHHEVGSVVRNFGPDVKTRTDDVLLVHSWGGGKHLYGIISKYSQEPLLTEAEYDAAARNRRIRDRALRIWTAVEGFHNAPANETGANFLVDLQRIREEIDPPEPKVVEGSPILADVEATYPKDVVDRMFPERAGVE